MPLVVGTASTLIGYPLIGILALPFPTLAAIALVAGLSAPLLALVLGTAAPNKVAGFAVVKILNPVNLLPNAPFFLPVPLQSGSSRPADAGVLGPAAAGDPCGPPLAIGAGIGLIAIATAAWLFERRLLRRG